MIVAPGAEERAEFEFLRRQPKTISIESTTPIATMTISALRISRRRGDPDVRRMINAHGSIHLDRRTVRAGRQVSPIQKMILRGVLSIELNLS
jgi:hypothetical protein